VRLSRALARSCVWTDACVRVKTMWFAKVLHTLNGDFELLEQGSNGSSSGRLFFGVPSLSARSNPVN